MDDKKIEFIWNILIETQVLFYKTWICICNNYKQNWFKHLPRMSFTQGIAVEYQYQQGCQHKRENMISMTYD